MIHKHGSLVKAWEAKVRKSQAAAKKRANALFATMSVAHVDDEDNLAGPSEVHHVEKFLSDGDFYMGRWAGNIAHGHGKYLWTDGCTYVGEWHKGKPMGRGKFCWPNGATYEGDFNAGYMDGKGTYTGPSGDTYKGDWVMNLKHGQGTKSYSNGDRYEGEWRRGLQEGDGRYQWMNGNHYTGQWKMGLMDGNGTLIWTNGNRYDGFWEDGFPQGNGTFRWSDGSFYVGDWCKDAEEQNGTYHPSETGGSSNPEWNPQEVFSVDLQDCQICPGEKVPIMPSQKVYNWPGGEGELSCKEQMWSASRENHGGGRLKRMSVDGRVYNCSWSSDAPDNNSQGNSGVLGGLQTEYSDIKVTPTRHHLLRIKPPKRQGEIISKGHRNYELMLNLQLGIRHSVGKPAPATSLNLKSSAFDPREKVWTRFPPEGSKHTPPHQSSEFRWKDYCPMVFRTLRKLFKVDPADYMLSICGNEALRELSSPGKSGSFFYLTNDDRYMVKTIKKAEGKVLLRMLPAYYKHVRTFENTLVTKFFGLHCVKLNGPAQKKVRFVIMGNLFCSEYAIHRRYDLKGSSHGRLTLKPESEIEATTTLKDLDLSFIFRLQKTWFEEFCRQVDRDCDFLEQERIMDYSLLVGLHFRQVSQDKDYQVAQQLPSGLLIPRGNGESDGDTAGPRLSSTDMDNSPVNPSSLGCMKLGINMPALAERTIRRSGNEQQLVGEPTGNLYDIVIFFGIIDILQDYDISKKLEHVYKSIHHDPTSISAVDPRQYSRRFRDFIFRIFVEDT